MKREHYVALAPPGEHPAAVGKHKYLPKYAKNERAIPEDYALGETSGRALAESSLMRWLVMAEEDLAPSWEVVEFWSSDDAMVPDSAGFTGVFVPVVGELSRTTVLEWLAARKEGSDAAIATAARSRLNEYEMARELEEDTGH